jgi:hypothetical protein
MTIKFELSIRNFIHLRIRDRGRFGVNYGSSHRVARRIGIDVYCRSRK